MNNVIRITNYEIKMMRREKAYWIALLIVIILSAIDNIPIESNMERLPFTVVPGYTVSRLLIQMGVILVYFLTYLFANRILTDKKTGMISIFKVYNISKTEYIFGKLLGAFWYYIGIFFLYLLCTGVIFFVASPSIFEVKSYIIGFVVSVIPVGFFIVNASISLPLLIGKKLTYLMMTLYFMINVMIVPNSNSLPPYFLFYGELIKNIYKYGLEGVDTIAMIKNAIFLLGGGLVFLVTILKNHKVWESYEEV